MSKLFFAVFAVLLVQAAYGRVTREAPVTPNPVVDMFQQAFGLFNNVTDELHKAFLKSQGVSNNEELWTKTKENFNTFENTLRSAIDNLNEETKPIQGKAQELFNAFTAKANQVVDDLKSKNPEFFSGDFKKIQELGNNSFRTIAEEAQKLRSNLESMGQELSPQIDASIKQISESAVKSVQLVTTQLEAAVSNIGKKN